MSNFETNIRIVSCKCGDTKMELIDEPILSAICHCDDCRKAAKQLEQLENAPPILDEYSGTGFHLYRKDRLQSQCASNLLQDYRLANESPTRRVVATCCNSFMFLDFEKGHWLSVFHGRFGKNAPNMQMRIQTKFKSDSQLLPNNIQSYTGFPFKFIYRLLAAKIAMIVNK